VKETRKGEVLFCRIHLLKRAIKVETGVLNSGKEPEIKYLEYKTESEAMA